MFFFPQNNNHCKFAHALKQRVLTVNETQVKEQQFCLQPPYLCDLPRSLVYRSVRGSSWMSSSLTLILNLIKWHVNNNTKSNDPIIKQAKE